MEIASIIVFLFILVFTFIGVILVTIEERKLNKKYRDKDDNVFGEIFWNDGHCDLYFDGKVKVRYEDGEEIEITKKEISFNLMNPTCFNIRYYKDEKHHWTCVIYEDIEIDIWADNLDDLFQLIAYLCRDWMDVDKIEECE